MTQRDLAERVRRSSALLFGGVLAVSTVSAIAGIELGYAESGWDRLLSLAIGVSLLLRSRVFSRILHMTPLRVAGAAVLAALGVRLGASPEVRSWFVVLVAVAGTVLVVLSAAPMSDITRARVKRTLNWAESALITALIALAAAGFGLYRMVADLTR
jgi:hypothetical protein